MSRIWSAALRRLWLLTPGVASAASAVFANDPIDPATSLPYEILPGMPLVTPGPDGRLGTADDVVDATIVGGDPANRLPSGLWPSDHAGVVVTLQL